MFDVVDAEYYLHQSKKQYSRSFGKAGAKSVDVMGPGNTLACCGVGWSGVYDWMMIY